MTYQATHETPVTSGRLLLRCPFLSWRMLLLVVRLRELSIVSQLNWTTFRSALDTSVALVRTFRVVTSPVLHVATVASRTILLLSIGAGNANNLDVRATSCRVISAEQRFVASVAEMYSIRPFRKGAGTSYRRQKLVVSNTFSFEVASASTLFPGSLNLASSQVDSFESLDSSQ